VDVNFIRGKVESSDASPAHAAAREVGEETGVAVEARHLEPLGAQFSQTVYAPQKDGTEAGRPQKRKTQAFVLDCAAAEDAAPAGFRARKDCRHDVSTDETAERARIAEL
jgi:8-oxo-dGTP pyrophosphatase MutT (NUDIX family)